MLSDATLSGILTEHRGCPMRILAQFAALARLGFLTSPTLSHSSNAADAVTLFSVGERGLWQSTGFTAIFKVAPPKVDGPSVTLLGECTEQDSRPQIDDAQLALLWAEPLPNPQRQADLLILALERDEISSG